MRHPSSPQPIGVLIIDDDDGIRVALTEALQDQGIATVAAADGDAGLQVLEQSPIPLVVLLDYIMAGDGEQFLRKVLGEPALVARHAYVLISASPGRFSPEIEALRARLEIPSVAKPFDLEHLLQVVTEAVGRLEAR